MSAFTVISFFICLGVISFTKSTETETNAALLDSTCKPGETFADDCNICTCTAEGKVGFCTYKLCPTVEGLIRPGHPKFKCTPGELFRHDCYDCRCYDGKNSFCTFASCNTKNNAQHFCEDGESKKNECNLCKCINQEWACTKKFCVPEVEIFEYKTCESGSILRRGCNLCRCVSDVGYACDKEECPPDQPTDLIEDRNCTAESTYNISCNICKCIPGLGYACNHDECQEADLRCVLPTFSE